MTRSDSLNLGLLILTQVFRKWVPTVCAVSRRWKREKNRTPTPLTSYWWRTRRWTFPTPSSDTLPRLETTSKTLEEELDTIWQHTHRWTCSLHLCCTLDNHTSPLTSNQTLKDVSAVVSTGVLIVANHTYSKVFLILHSEFDRYLLCIKAILPKSKVLKDRNSGYVFSS